MTQPRTGHRERTRFSRVQRATARGLIAVLWITNAWSVARPVVVSAAAAPAASRIVPPGRASSAATFDAVLSDAVLSDAVSRDAASSDAASSHAVSRGSLSSDAVSSDGSTIASALVVPRPPAVAQGGGTPPPPSGVRTGIFGPKRYTRTTGSPNQFRETVSVPAWHRSPFVLHVLNGNADGEDRVTSATVHVNGTSVLAPSDFKKHIYVLERSITLAAASTATIDIELRSKPGSYITLSLFGTNGDTQAPALTITAPAHGSTTASTTPALSVTYADPAASGGVASGIDQATFRGAIDGTDRTALFQRTASGATATLPPSASLGDGTHTFTASIKDRAGNEATATSTFTVQTVVTPPSVTITSPASGAIVRTSPIAVSGTFIQHVPGGGAVTVQCRRGSTTAAAQVSGSSFTCSVPLVEGDNTIEVAATDSRGGTGGAMRPVVLDTTAPILTITSPTDRTFTAATHVTVSGTVQDARAVTVTVNGVAATVSGQQFEAVNVPAGAGPTLAIDVVAEDAAGNRQTAAISINVVRTPLTLAIASPAADSVVRGPIVEVHGTTSRDLPVDVTVNDQPATVEDGAFVAQVSVSEGVQTLRATARDAAGRTENAAVTVRVDTIAPAITISEPAPGLITNAATVRVVGSVPDASTVTLRVGDEDVPVVGGQFSTSVLLPSEGPVTIPIAATDAAGNVSTAAVELIVDRTTPVLAIVAPTAGAVMAGLPILVQGTVTDATATTVTVDTRSAARTSDAWQASFDALPDGPHTFVVIATDAAGNSTTKDVTVSLDTNAPTLTIASPAPGTLTRFDRVDVTGTVTDSSTVTVTVNDRLATIAGDTFTATGVPLAEGDTVILVRATDTTGRATEATVIVARDSTAPQIELAAPERTTRRQQGRAVATVTDAGGVTQVVFAVQGAHAGTATAEPYAIDLAVPDDVAIGGTFVVTATATDRAGNVATATRGVRVAADGAIVGQVLSDATGLPLEGVTVRIGADTRTTDAQGRYTIATEDAAITLVADRDGMTSVTRVVSMSSGVGTVPIDARLTPLAASVEIGPDGGQLTTAPAASSGTGGSGSGTGGSGTGTSGTSGSGAGGSGTAGGASSAASTTAIVDATVVVNVSAGVVSALAGFRLTGLSAQGLPELLPLGWSPLAAFDLRSAAALQGGSLDVRVTFAQPDTATTAGPLALVQYRPLLHAWTVVRRDLTPAGDGAIATSLPGLGVFALVVPDALDPSPAMPAVGEPLAGVAVVELPANATSQGVVEPSVLPPTGGTARGQLVVQTPTPLPSGTLVQTEITETFTLPSGQVASEELRRADVVLYRTPLRKSGSGEAPPPALPDAPPVGAIFPITPSRTFEPAQLVEGRVHLDVLAGRESIRGVTGGREAVTVTSEDARLSVPGGALGEDTAVSLARVPFSALLPTHAALTPLAEVTIDVAGRALTSPAELSIAAAASGATPAGTFVIARVDRIDGIPALVVVARAEVDGDRLVARPTAGLPGVSQGGRYVFYRVTGGLAFVQGFTRAGVAAIAAVVSSDSVPFVARSSVDGRYTLAVLAGTPTLRARVPHTSLETQDSVSVAAGEIGTLTLTLAAAVTTATISPADGTRGVPRHAQVVVTTTTPINPTSITADAIRLVKVNGTATTDVAVRLILSGSRQALSIVPSALLDADATYRADVGGLADQFGGAIAVPQTTFQTAAESAPTYSTDALTFSFPDADGNVTISAREDSFPAGVQFLIINSTSGEVLSFGSRANGSINETIRATLDDRLIVTITDADGRVTTFTRSQFVDQATGRTAIGPGGGIVEGPDGSALLVPEGAVARAVTLKITPLGSDAFPKKPGLPDGQFGGGIQVEAPPDATFSKEVDVAFPVPQAALEAADRAGLAHDKIGFYVYRRVMADDGEPIFVTVDYARIEGNRVVTQSFPFSGFFGLAASYMLLMWAIDQHHPGQPTTGAITGQVLRAVFDPGATTPHYVGEPGALVLAEDAAGNLLEPRTGAYASGEGGRYTLYDHRLTDGPIQVRATVGTETARMTVTPVQRTDTAALTDPALTTLFKNIYLKQISTANLTFPPKQPDPPAPALTIRVMKTVDSRRVDTRGLVVEGTPLTLGVSSAASQGNPSTITGLRIVRQGGGAGSDTSIAVQPDPARQQQPRDPLAMDVIGAERFTPEQPGTYTVIATGLPAFGPAFEASVTLRVLAAGGGLEPVVGKPRVITAQTVPKADATNVPVGVLPHVAFTEPVLNIPGHVQLLDAQDAEVPIRISAVGVDAQGAPIVISDVTSAATIVTSLTIEPLLGLAYDTRYRLVLKDGIHDRDVTPSTLDQFETAFMTFGPQPLGVTEQQFSSPGLVVLGDRAYVLESLYAGGVGGQQRGSMHVFDITDPMLPQLQPPSIDILAAPRDIGGELRDEIATVAVVTMPHTQFVPGAGTSVDIASGPANLFVYDASGPTPQWTGVASLSDGIVDGVPNRVVVKDQVAYVAMARKGIQVVDLSRAALGELASLPAFEQYRRIHAPGEGVNPQAVVANVRVVDPANPGSTATIWLNDLKVDDYQVEGTSQRLVLATGSPAAIGLVIANPVSTQIVWQGALTSAGGALSRGEAIALARIANRDLAVVGGSGTTTSGGASGVVAIVDLQPLSATPRGAPEVLAWVALTHGVGDIAIVDQTAVVSSPTLSGANSSVATLINLTDPVHPRLAGTLTGLASRLAITADGIVLSTNRTYLKGNVTALDRLRSATLGYVTVISQVKEDPVILAADRKSIEPRTITYRAIFPHEDVETSELEILRNDAVISTLPAPLDEHNTGQITLPAGFSHPAGTTIRARLIVNRGKSPDLQPSAKARVLRGEAFRLDPAEAEITRIGEEPFPAVALNSALSARLLREPPAAVPAFTWSGPGVLAPWALDPGGIHSVELSAVGAAGAREPIRLMLGDTLMASSGPLTVLPGHAAVATLRVSPPPQSPTIWPGNLPADGKTEITLTIEDIRDAFGNLIEDGTPIGWAIVGDGDGELLGVKQSITSGGRASVRYRAGVEPGYRVVRASVPVPDPVGELVREQLITQSALTASLEENPAASGSFTLTVGSEDAGPPADGTPVGWILERGSFTGWVELQNGHAEGTWTDWPDSYFQPGQPRQRFVSVGAIVGKTVDGLMHDTQRALVDTPANSGKKIFLGDDTLLPAAPQPMTMAGPPEGAPVAATASDLYPSSTNAHVVGGAPGETVRLALGSTRFPVVEPIAAFTFDAIERVEGEPQGLAADVYEGEPATVTGAVDVAEPDAARAAGAYRFAGSGQVTIADRAAFALTRDFGVSGWVSFDDLTPGQTLVQKAGAYSVQLVTEAGETRIELAIQGGGQRHRVLSRQTIAAGTWYQFAAHFRRGQLALAVGDDLIALADVAGGSADLSTEPIVIGSGLSGRLDDIAVYDLSRAPFVTFADGTTETTITLDDQGRGSVAVVAQVTPFPPAPSGGGGGAGLMLMAAAAAAPQLADPGQLALAAQLRQPAIRTITTQPDNETFGSRFRVEWLRGSQNCVEGLATGEGDLWSQQTACDVFVGLLPFTSTPQALRDLTIAGNHLVNGKRDVGNYVKASFALLVLGASIVPGLRALGRVVGKAHAAAIGTKAEAILAKEAMERLMQAYDLPPDAVRTSGLGRVLAAESGDTAAREALLAVLTACRVGIASIGAAACNPLGDEFFELFERAAGANGHEALSKALGRVVRDPGLGLRVAEDMVRALARLPLPLQLSDDALDGLAVFVRRVPGETRLPNMWDELTNVEGLTTSVARGVLERTFTLVKQGEARFGNAPGWQAFLGRGPGTGPVYRPTRGFHHQLDRMLAHADDAPVSIDSKFGTELMPYSGRPDAMVERAEEIIQQEFKVIDAGRRLSPKDIGQLKRNIRAALTRARNLKQPNQVDVTRLRDELRRIEYHFRGDTRQDLINQVQNTVRDVLRTLQAQGMAENEVESLVALLKIDFKGTLPY